MWIFKKKKLAPFTLADLTAALKAIEGCQYEVLPSDQNVALRVDGKIVAFVEVTDGEATVFYDFTVEPYMQKTTKPQQRGDENIVISRFGVMVKDVGRAVEDNAEEIQHFLDSFARPQRPLRGPPRPNTGRRPRRSTPRQ